jgi:hypothetical protein
MPDDEKYLRVIWSNMVQRCTNKKDPSFRFYGGATPPVTIYKPWLNFEIFAQDVLEEIGHRPPGRNHKTNLSLYQFDRINSFQGYQPTNIRWATVLQNERNKRPPRTSTRKKKEKVPDYLVFTNSSSGFLRMNV